MNKTPITKTRAGAMETVITLQVVEKPNGQQFSFTFPKQIAQANGYQKGDRFAVRAKGETFTLQRLKKP